MRQFRSHDHHHHEHHHNHDHSAESAISEEYRYHLSSHTHGDHSHFNLSRKTHHDHGHSHDDHHRDHKHSHGSEHAHDEDCGDCDDGSHKKFMARSDEGCPCCVASIDLDEVATALNEIAKNGSNTETHGHSLGELADFSSGVRWGIFLGISGPMALIGLTAAIRNIKGTLSNRKKLEAVIKGLEEDISRYEERRDKAKGKDKEDLGDVIKRLEAFRETLKYSKFDTNFNLAVPGVINGAASTIVLSSAIVSSPWALPVIALYAGCQTMRNGYDLWRTWNRILPEEVREEVQLNMNVGIRKINQITDSKRKFYAANTLGFAAFTAGAVITTLSALSVVGLPGLAVGIPLLAAGAVSTGITNNIWTAKFKPRNGDLGIDRTELDLDTIKQEIGERREIKKLLKNYRDKHLPAKLGKRFGCSLLSSLPFCSEKGQKLLHGVNQSRISESDSSDKDRLDLLERAINAKVVLKKAGNHKETDPLLKKISGLEKISEAEKGKFGLVSFDKKKPICEQIFSACRELEIDTMVLDRFIKNAIIKSSDEHESSIKTKDEYFEKLRKSSLFTIDGDEVTFDLKALEGNQEMKKAFMNSLEECLLFDYVEKLKYEQYGLNDFYWALDKQNKKQPHSHGHKHQRHHKHHHHKHSHNHGHDHDHSCADEEDHKGKKHDHSHHEHHKHHSHHEHSHPVAHSDTHAHHQSLCRPCHLPSAHQRKKSAIEHDHSHHEHNRHEHQPASDSHISEEGSKSTTPETEQKLLNEFRSFAAEKISQNKEERRRQVTKQNKVIDKVLEKSHEFVLKSETKNHEKNQTVFVYLDPNHQNPDDPDYEVKQVTYLRNDSTGKIDVLYGEKANALIIERPQEQKNGLITKISHSRLEHYGEISGGIFQSFRKANLSKELPTGSLRQAKSQNLTESGRSLAY